MSKPVVFITGASEGIGRATAVAFGRAGFAVGITARNQTRLTALIAELTSVGALAASSVADVSDPAAVTAMVADLTSRLGPPNVLVNNAGIAIAKPFLDTTLEEWDRTFATNVRSLYLVTQAVLPGMMTRGGGDIVNLASLAGKNGVANAAAYSASKHAVLGFGRSLMLEVRKAGVRVISICPGSVDTPLLRNAPGFSPNWDQILRPEDVAEAIVAAVKQPRRSMVSELEVRPANP